MVSITWNKESTERLIAALLASNPKLSLDYELMAIYFGQGATYDSIQHRFREYRRVASTMAQGSPAGGTQGRRGVISTPRKNSRGGIAKTGFTKKTPTELSSYITPSKNGRFKGGNSSKDAICLSDDDCKNLLKQEPKKEENQDAFQVKAEDVFTDAPTTAPSLLTQNMQAQAEREAPEFDPFPCDTFEALTDLDEYV
ncbi:hypothetical protein LOZ12_004814 [Ophidiomyces ophidiicola]|uniref:Uncharacterized protein n=1 Tax=Ophidiomyces ophidiicola TaxID=1387563 RepID=A0ACB8UYH7_9EURO|nr:hypothetical protein LOZ64_004272 [Ophidiomyces ophidiicola]KAI1915301.1 hypothetical protein LOZ61_001699 [Ophidiomyces ophidiicola]KAI1926785.1 hypothetical protein LOZ60_003382 [Ophidiomyces ophidiicola]KAI1945945.1 hypothetical protein LOZ62_003548 [Ophidiomyces ophidiicola]KAI1955999.1 hypothetical protein LOZ59_004381 [Ophidiomyces ophidiicola]